MIKSDVCKHTLILFLCENYVCDYLQRTIRKKKWLGEYEEYPQSDHYIIKVGATCLYLHYTKI